MANVSNGNEEKRVNAVLCQKRAIASKIRTEKRRSIPTVNIAATEPSRLFKIGQVASKSGLSVKTIRYYEEIGLLAPHVKRADSGYRMFEPSVLNRLAFVKRAQSLGLSLAEIAQILNIHDDGKLPCGEVRHCLETKLDSINSQIESLEMLRDELQGILSGWQEQPSPERISKTICPNIQ
ncbi:MAG: heavy metal-responsive transcriptional regulator [Leptolyngbyaceae bacterium]|nr:heavy metal-responsive transcriptional regulator [Leptolyngbyaceae bacterium]